MFWASRPAAEIWQVGLALVKDKHPPLYYLLLRNWTLLFGTSDAAARSLGALIGALAVLPVYGIGNLLGKRRLAVLAALLVALNPFLVWYSQEVRMFMPATTWILVGLYGVIGLSAAGQVQQRPSTRTAGQALASDLSRELRYAALIVIGFTAALYSYLFSAFMLPVAGAWLLLDWWQGRNRRRLLLGATALALVALLFLPLARSAWLVSGRESTPGRPFLDLGQTAARLLKVYAVGRVHWPAAGEQIVKVGAAGLLLLGLLVPEAGRTGKERLLGGLKLTAWLLLPMLIGGLLQARDRRVFAETRYFIFLVPGLCLAWSRGLTWLLHWRRQMVGVLATAIVVGSTVAALPADWAPENRREAWREAAAYLRAHAGANDAVLVQVDYVRVALERYLTEPLALFFPFTDVLTDPAWVNEQLTGLTGAGFDVIWLVQSHHQELDPEDLVLGWFAGRYPLVTEQFPAGIAIHAFAINYRLPRDDWQARVAVQSPSEALHLTRSQAGLSSPGGTLAGGKLQLLDCVSDPGPVTPRDDLYHPPSGWVHVITYWTVEATPQQDLYPDVRLVDDSGQVWGDRLVRENDAIHLWPTSRWQPTEVVRVDYDVNLNPETPAGRYRLVISVPDQPGALTCGEITVE